MRIDPRFLVTLLLPVLLSDASADERRFPLDVVADEGTLGGVEVRLDPARARALDGLGSVTLTDVPLPGGERVALVLERVAYDPRAAEVADGGLRGAARLDADDLALWSGTVAGEPGSQAYLALSPLGTRGWIRRGAATVHLLAGPGADGDWSASRTRIVTEDALLTLGTDRPRLCADEALPRATYTPPASAPGAGAGGQLALGTGSTLLCRMAIETDFQLYQKFNNVAAEQVYLHSLFGAMAQRYLQQVNVRLEIAYLGLHSSANDGWVAGDNGAGSGAMLDEFRSAWAGDVPNGAHLAHFVSGAGLGGGVAYLDVLCNDDWGFAVSGDLAGNTPFPVVQGPLTWDFFVFAHETGHNFGSPHTQDFCPPLDQCVPSCASGTQCTTNGTIMSYCHGCPGGMNNITPEFHTVCADLMRTRAEASCLPDWCVAPQSFCIVEPNSFSSGAHLTTTGSTFVSRNDLTLVTIGVPPGSNGLYIYGASETLVPFGNGWMCVAAPLSRLGVTTANFVGDAALVVDLTALPATGPIQAGDTRRFQLWFRDVPAGGAGFNLSDGLELTFCP